MKRVAALCVVVVATGLTVLAGAAPAIAASELCSTNTSPCTGVKYGLPVEFEAKMSGTQEAIFTTSFADVHCQGSILEWTAEEEAGGELTGTITKLSFSNCTPCTVAVVRAGRMYMDTEQVKANGRAILSTRGTELTFKCVFWSCLFGTPTTGSYVGVFSGSATLPLVNVSASLAFFKGDSSELVCTGKNDGTGVGAGKVLYEVSRPSPVFFE